MRKYIDKIIYLIIFIFIFFTSCRNDLGREYSFILKEYKNVRSDTLIIKANKLTLFYLDKNNKELNSIFIESKVLDSKLIQKINNTEVEGVFLEYQNDTLYTWEMFVEIREDSLLQLSFNQRRFLGTDLDSKLDSISDIPLNEKIEVVKSVFSKIKLYIKDGNNKYNIPIDKNTKLSLFLRNKNYWDNICHTTQAKPQTE